MRRFSQVDVFSPVPGLGNPVAVVHDAEGLTEESMQRLAAWTNLSETTFLLPPTTPDADYRVRIWTPSGELPFAGHPTLGTAHAWLAAGGAPRTAGRVVQECAAGLVPVRPDGDRLAFAGPPLVRSGPVDEETIDRVRASLRLAPEDIVDVAWADNGPGWVAVLLRSADAVLDLQPDVAVMGGLFVGAVGPHPDGGPADVEVRAFAPGSGIVEDPVTGSLNAGVAEWLIGAGVLPTSYVARQGTRLGRDGRVHIEQADDAIWVGGAVNTLVSGTIDV